MPLRLILAPIVAYLVACPLASVGTVGLDDLSARNGAPAASATLATSGDTLEPAALRAAFERLYCEHWQVVARVIARARLDDPEDAAATVWLKAWRGYPRMVRRQEADPEGCRHRWRGWLATIARRVVVDAKRRLEVERRLYGVPAYRRVGVEGAGVGGGCEGGVLERVDVDDLPASAGVDVGGDPEAALLAGELGEGLAALVAAAGLSVRELLVFDGWLLGEDLRTSARRLGVTVGRVRDVRHRVAVRVRACAVGR